MGDDHQTGDSTVMRRLRKAWRILRQDGAAEVLRQTKQMILSRERRDRMFSVPPLAKLSLVIAERRLEALKEQEDSWDDILQTPYRFRGFGLYDTIRPLQHENELRFLAEKARGIEPDIVVEIGTAFGGTFYVWCRGLNPEHVVSIDLPGTKSGAYPYSRTPLLERFTDNAEVTAIRGDSKSVEVREELERVLDGRKVDFLFIDGDHSYEGVKADFENYSRYVRDGGIIAFDDIIEDPTRGVHKFWKEIEGDYKTEEHIEPDWNAGIGILHWS